jgi:uncharacterized damage-inducible protein DinB
VLKDHLLNLIDYNYWANGLILKYADRMEKDQYHAKTAYSQFSIHEILVHILFAEWLWRLRMSGNSPDLAMISSHLRPEDFSNLDEVLESWFEEEMAMRDFIDKFPQEKLLESFKYKNAQGDEFKNVYMDIFTHLVFHGMQHRAEAATILHMYNQSPGDIDYIRYLRQR